MDTSIQQIIIKEIAKVSRTVSQLDMIKIFIQGQQCEHSSKLHGTYTKINHILGHKNTLTHLKTVIIQCMSQATDKLK